MRRLLGIVIGCLMLAGCGGELYKTSSYDAAEREPDSDVGMIRSLSADKASGARVTSSAAAPVERKIIHDVEFAIVVNDFSDVPARIDQLIKKFDGAYVAQMNLTGSEGQSRSGRWQIRVPVADQDTFLERVRSLGQVTREESRADDVSEEYYDLQARLKNKRETEARLLKVQQERTGELKDILDVEQQIDRVRGEIEQMQGRLERLTTLTSLSTVTIAIHEIRDYKPPQAISLVDRIASTFSSSVDGLREFGEGTLLFLTALAPWLPLLVAAFFLSRFLLRRMIRRMAAAKKAAEPTPATPAAPA